MSDPTIGGPAGSWFSAVGVQVLGMDYLRDLAKQEIMFSRDLRQLAEWLARGKYSVLIASAAGQEVELQKAGAPIATVLPKEGGYLTAGGSGTIGVCKNNPHPNATKVFINWLTGKEAGTIISRGVNNQSARLDVPTDFLDSEGVRKAGVPYFNSINEKFQTQQTEYQKLAREIFNIR